MSTCWRVKRLHKKGMVPPLCDQIQLILGNLLAAPLNTKLATVRVVSVANSMAEGGKPSMGLRQQSGMSGWV